MNSILTYTVQCADKTVNTLYKSWTLFLNYDLSFSCNIRRCPHSPWNHRHPPPPQVDKPSGWSQVDEPSTRRRLRSAPPPPPPLLRPLNTRRLNSFCSIASMYFGKVVTWLLLYHKSITRLKQTLVSQSHNLALYQLLPNLLSRPSAPLW